MVISPQGFRGGEDGHGHAVFQSLLVPPALEIPDDEIALHLELSHRAVIVLFAALSESGQLLELVGGYASFLQDLIHDLFAPEAGQPIVPTAVEVISVPPCVGEQGKPPLGNKTRLIMVSLGLETITRIAKLL